MELIVKVNKLNDIYTLDNADAYLVANRHFSYRYDESFCINKIFFFLVTITITQLTQRLLHTLPHCTYRFTTNDN